MERRVVLGVVVQDYTDAGVHAGHLVSKHVGTGGVGIVGDNKTFEVSYVGTGFVKI